MVAAGTRLDLLRESSGGPVGPSEDLDLDQASMEARLRQTELDWSSLVLDLPVVRLQLHKVRDHRLYLYLKSTIILFLNFSAEVCKFTSSAVFFLFCGCCSCCVVERPEGFFSLNPT